MTIYANTTQSFIFVDPTLIGSLPSGSSLVWDATMRRFVPSVVPATAITNLVNIGTGDVGLVDSFTTAPGVNAANIRELKAGSGISLSIPTGEDYVLISSNVTADQLSVPGSYRITIDNDGNTPDSLFEIYTASTPLNFPISYTPTPINPITSTTLFTGTSGGVGIFYSTTQDFFGLGVRSGQYIQVSGTDHQDGVWQVANVVLTTVGSTNTSTISLVQNFTGDAALGLGGPQPTTTISFADLYVPPPDDTLPDPYDPTLMYKLQSVSQDFGPAGLDLVPGMILQIRGAQNLQSTDQSIDGNYTIAQVTSRGSMPGGLSTLLFTYACPIPGPGGMIFEPDPSDPQITLTVEATEIPTGFTVDKSGDITGTQGTFTGSIYSGTNTSGSDQPTAYNELTRKDYVDSLLTGLTEEANSWSEVQSFTTNGITLQGSSTGITTFSSANSSATNYTITVPAITDTLVTLTATQTLTNKTINGSNNTLSNIALTSLSTISNNTLLGNNSGSSASPSTLTPTQVTALLNTFTSSLNGLVPLSGGGTTTFLRADGNWATPSGTSLGTVTSVSLTSSGNTLSTSGSPITSSGSINIDLNLSNNNTWTGVQTFSNNGFRLLGSSSGYVELISANSTATNYVLTLPAITSTVAVLDAPQYWNATQTFANNGIRLLGQSNGYTTFTSSNNSNTNYVITVPAITDTLATLSSDQTFSGNNTFSNLITTSNTGIAIGGATSGGVLLTTETYPNTGSLNLRTGDNSGDAFLTAGAAEFTDAVIFDNTIYIWPTTEPFVQGTNGEWAIYSDVNDNVLKLKDYNSNIISFPIVAGTVAILDAVQTLTNKTLTAPIADRYLVSSSNINLQSGTSYTLQNSDNGKTIVINNGSAISVSLNTGLDVGFWCTIIQSGTGQITLGGTSTLRTAIGLKTRAQYAMMNVVFEGSTDTYIVGGDVSA